MRFFLSSDAISFFDSCDVFFEAFSWFLIWDLCLKCVKNLDWKAFFFFVGIKIGLLRPHAKTYIVGERGSVLARKARICKVHVRTFVLTMYRAYFRATEK